LEETAQRGPSSFLHLAEYYWGDKMKNMKWTGHMARVGERRGTNMVLVGKHERKKPLGRPIHRW